MVGSGTLTTVTVENMSIASTSRRLPAGTLKTASVRVAPEATSTSPGTEAATPVSVVLFSLTKFTQGKPVDAASLIETAPTKKVSAIVASKGGPLTTGKFGVG